MPDTEEEPETKEKGASRVASRTAGKKSHGAVGSVVVAPREYPRLKARHRAEREGYATNVSLTVHRALSWLDGS